MSSFSRSKLDDTAGVFVEALGPRVVRYITSVEDLCFILSRLPVTSRFKFLIDLGYDKNLHLLKAPFKYDGTAEILGICRMLLFLSPTEQIAFIQALGDRIKEVVYDHRTLKGMLFHLRAPELQEVRLVLVASLGDSLSNMLTRNSHLCSFLEQIPGKNRIDFIKSLGIKVKSRITNAKKLADLLAVLPENYRLKFLVALGYNKELDLLRGFFIDSDGNAVQNLFVVLQQLSVPKQIVFIYELDSDIKEIRLF